MEPPEPVQAVTWENGKVVPLTPERQAEQLIKAHNSYEEANRDAYLETAEQRAFRLEAARRKQRVWQLRYRGLALLGLFIGMLYLSTLHPAFMFLLLLTSWLAFLKAREWFEEFLGK